MSTRTKKFARWLLALGAGAAILYGGWWYLCESVFYASIGYRVEAQFAELPPDDEALAAWLKQQPGVAVVRISRTESTKTVYISLIMSQNFHDRPPFPDVESACAELGYKGQAARFRDTEPRPRH